MLTWTKENGSEVSRWTPVEGNGPPEIELDMAEVTRPLLSTGAEPEWPPAERCVLPEGWTVVVQEAWRPSGTVGRDLAPAREWMLSLEDSSPYSRYALHVGCFSTAAAAKAFAAETVGDLTDRWGVFDAFYARTEGRREDRRKEWWGYESGQAD